MTACLHADHRITRHLAVDELVVTLLGVKEHLLNDACVEQQSNGAVDRGLRHLMCLTLEIEQQFFCFETSITSDDRFKDIRAFLRVLQVA